MASQSRKRNGRLEGVDLGALGSSLDASREHFDKSLRSVDLDALREAASKLVSVAP